MFPQTQQTVGACKFCNKPRVDAHGVKINKTNWDRHVNACKKKHEKPDQQKPSRPTSSSSYSILKFYAPSSKKRKTEEDETGKCFLAFACLLIFKLQL